MVHMFYFERHQSICTYTTPHFLCEILPYTAGVSNLVAFLKQHQQLEKGGTHLRRLRQDDGQSFNQPGLQSSSDHRIRLLSKTQLTRKLINSNNASNKYVIGTLFKN